ncbi:MAG: hypothetical protein AB1523_11220 [Bacillota bacterium]
MLNLDLAAAEAGQEIVKITSPENKKQANELQVVIVRSLGVLQENGVYALGN